MCVCACDHLWLAPLFCCSDEDEEPEDVLMYLSISPDVENPDEVSGAEDAILAATSEIGAEAIGGSVKKSTESPSVHPAKRNRQSGAASQKSQPSSPKGHKFSIDLPDAPTDEVSPLFSHSCHMRYRFYRDDAYA